MGMLAPHSTSRQWDCALEELCLTSVPEALVKVSAHPGAQSPCFPARQCEVLTCCVAGTGGHSGPG